MDAISRITSAAIELFRHYSLKHVTIDDIARRAGISKKTYYQQFANKEELIMHVINFSQERIFAKSNQIIEESADPVTAMRQIFELLDDQAQSWNHLALFEMRKFYPECFEQYRQTIEQMNISVIRKLYINGKQDGYFRDVDSDLFARFKMEQLFQFVDPVTGINLQPEDRRLISEIILRGVLTEKGLDIKK